MQGALADLKSYVQRHPNDSVGHYELAMAEIVGDKEQAARELDRALALKPDFVAAHVTRGLLRYREGKTQAALPDFEFAAKREPQNPGILDRLGQVYMALGRTADALPVLKKAADLAPRDTAILLRYGRALTKAGQREEAAAVFARCRELGPARPEAPHTAGLVDFLSLSPEEQQERYRAGVERTVEKDP
jgi:Tfp pilus assembly protein PilF